MRVGLVDKVVANDGNLLHLDVSYLHNALNRGTRFFVQEIGENRGKEEIAWEFGLGWGFGLPTEKISLLTLGTPDA